MFHQMFHHGETNFKHLLIISQHSLTPMFTYKFLVNPRDNALRLRISNNRKKAEIGMGFNVHPDSLENALSETPDKANIKLRSSIMAWSVRIEDVRLDLMDSGRENADVKEIKGLVLRAIFGDSAIRDCQEDTIGQPARDKAAFTSHFQAFINAKSNKGTKGVYQHTLDRIRLYDPDIDKKSFEEIDLKWLAGFEALCAQTASKNARNIHLRNIRLCSTTPLTTNSPPPILSGVSRYVLRRHANARFLSRICANCLITPLNHTRNFTGTCSSLFSCSLASTRSTYMG